MTKRTSLFQPATKVILIAVLFSSVTCLFQFNQNGEFTVLQLTDQHYCETTDWDLKTQNLTRQLLEWVKPDLVVFSGDAVSGYTPGAYYHGFYYSCWEKWTQPVMEAGIPYAYILGNHDAEGDLNREEVVQLDQSNPLSVRTECEGIPNKSTFYVPIYSSKNQSQLAANIWMFDSGRYGCGSYARNWGCIDEEQLEWYDHTSEKLKHLHGKDVEHIAFLHIPIPEYLKVYNNKKFYGTAGEGIGCSSPDSKFFQHVKKNDDITAMFLGHDHWNDFGGWYKGVELVYGRKSGYGGYGDIRGARVIKFQEEYTKRGKLKVTRDHYVIFENGTINNDKKLGRRHGDKQTQCGRPFLILDSSDNAFTYAAGVVFLGILGLVLKRFV